MAFLPNSNTEKVKKYTSILANSTNWTSATTSKVNVGDVIVPCTSTGTQGTGAAGAYVIPAGAATSAATILLGVVVSIRQFGGEIAVSSLTSATVGTANTTSATPYVVEWVACKDTTIEWVADLVTANAGASTNYVQGYQIANSSGGTNSGNLVAGTIGSAIFTSYTWQLDSTGLLSKAVGRFNPIYCV